MDNIKSCISRLSTLIDHNTATSDTYFRRGKLYWRLGERAAAITDFNHAVALDPQSPAKAYLHMTDEIMDFFNPDIYNP